MTEPTTETFLDIVRVGEFETLIVELTYPNETENDLGNVIRCTCYHSSGVSHSIDLPSGADGLDRWSAYIEANHWRPLYVDNDSFHFGPKSTTILAYVKRRED